MKKFLILFTIILASCSFNIFNEKPMLDKATLAGGCFWCLEPPFEALDGVEQVITGYAGGETEDPTYEEVTSGKTGHLETVQITFDPEKISYGELLDVFWQHTDPTDDQGQFVDRGSQYRTAIFYENDEQKKIAEESIQNLEDSGKYEDPIVTELLPAPTFYEAEEYHQDYYKKAPERYKQYKDNSGREEYFEEQKLANLTPLQYDVTQSCSTEPPFDNEYWDEKRDGIYVDIVSGEPLFSSLDKFESGTGWPSFTKPLHNENIIEKEDTSLGTTRTEIKSKDADSHLGHVFDDGPGESGLRYCINSASLKFIPKEDLEKEGYAQYLELFE